MKLENLKIAAPCPMKFKDMAGDERVRFCGQCQLNVFNLSKLTKGAAEQLLIEKEGKVCVTFFQRFDGTVLTQDCRGGFAPTFWQKFRATQHKGAIAFVSAVLVALVFAGAVTLFGDNVRQLFATQVTGLAGERMPSQRTARA